MAAIRVNTHQNILLLGLLQDHQVTHAWNQIETIVAGLLLIADWRYSFLSRCMIAYSKLNAGMEYGPIYMFKLEMYSL